MQELTLEIINNNKDIHWQHKKRKSSQTGKHFQKYYEITLILEGSVKNYTPTSIQLLRTHDVVFMNKNIVHELIDIESDKTLKYINLAFSDTIMNRIKIIFPNFILPNNAFIQHLSHAKMTKLINFYNEINLNDNYYETNKDIELFLYQVIKEVIYHNDHQRSMYPNWFKSLLLDIQKKNNIKNVSDIFTKSPYSKQYTIKKFHEYLNMTPSEYLNKTKIDHSIELLISSDLSISNIAFECGYNNVEYFDRIFKKNTGLSPLRYRQTNKSLIED